MKTLGLLVVTFLIAMILGLVFSLPQYLVGGVMGVMGIDGDANPVLKPVLLILSSVGTLVGLLLYCIPNLALGFHYYSLVEARERTGLMDRVRALEEDEPEAGQTVAGV